MQTLDGSLLYFDPDQELWLPADYHNNCKQSLSSLPLFLVYSRMPSLAKIDY